MAKSGDVKGSADVPEEAEGFELPGRAPLLA